MKRELRDAWAKALRSGEYKQGREYLCKDNEYCCLGVLARVAGYDPYGEFGVNEYGDPDYVNDSEELSGQFMEQHGLDARAADKLINMNDGTFFSSSYGYLLFEPNTFPEIADWIDIHVEVED